MLASPEGAKVTTYSRFVLTTELYTVVFCGASPAEGRPVRYHASRAGTAGTALRNFVAPNSCLMAKWLFLAKTLALIGRS